jgi:hypothetical protein
MNMARGVRRSWVVVLVVAVVLVVSLAVPPRIVTA